MNRPPHPAMHLVGLPYVRGGESPEVGFDCFTLLRYVRSRWFELKTPTPGDAMPPADMPAIEAAAQGIYVALGGALHVHLSPWVQISEAEPGCAVAMGRARAGRLHHCGVVVDRGVLHALDTAGVAFTPLGRIGSLYSRVEFYQCRY